MRNKRKSPARHVYYSEGKRHFKLIPRLFIGIGYQHAVIPLSNGRLLDLASLYLPFCEISAAQYFIKSETEV